MTTAHVESTAHIRILLVDDHDLVRKELAAIRSTEVDLDLVGGAGDGREAVRFFQQFLPDVTLLDLRLPDKSGIDAAGGRSVIAGGSRFWK